VDYAGRFNGGITFEVDCEGYGSGVHEVRVRVSHANGVDEGLYELICDQ
jgi:hypothetical protein